ncbi:MAG: signal transduction histidine kinase [Gemmataceae bacterium]|nr:signal transduction histidine kinase [Gemmataceae bacterium]
MDFFTDLVDTSDFPARWNCGAWTPGLGWMHILSDLAVWAAYLAIPCVLAYFVRRRKDVPFPTIFWLFGAFILACGTTHLMEAVLFWWPAYRLAGLIKLVAALVSWATVLALIPVVPRALALRSPRELEREIAERKKVEEAHRLATARLDLAVRGSNIGIWEIDMPDGVYRTGRVDFTNVLEQLGYYGPEEATDFATRMALIHPADREPVEGAIQAYLAGKTGQLEVEHRARHKDGSYRWMLSRGVATRDPTGRPVRMIGSSIEITAHKRAEEALRVSEERFRRYFELGLVGMAITSPAKTWIEINDELCRILGYDRGELSKKTWAELTHPDDLAADLANFDRVLAGEIDGYSLDKRWIRKDGEVVHAIISVRCVRLPDGAVDYFVSLLQDVTARKRAEEALRDSEARFRTVANAAPILIWQSDPDMQCFFFNQPRLAFTGRTLEQEVGSGWTDGLHPDDLPHCLAAYAEAFDARREFEIDYRLRRADGEYRTILDRGTPVFGVDGTFTGYIGGGIDITERGRAEAALRASEERFRGTFENAAVGIAHKDAAGRFLRVNEKYCEVVGYTREELLARSSHDITHPADLVAELGQYTRLTRGEVPCYSLEKRYIRKDGSLIWIDQTVSLQRDAAGRPAYAIAVLQDTSERKRLEWEFRQAKEAAEAANRAKDEFLANVSHEIRTPMNAILGMTELALDTPLTEDQRQCLETVKSAADNLLGIINDLLDFSKITAGKLDLDPTDFSLRVVVGETLRSLAMRAHKKGLELVCHVDPAVPDALLGDAGRLRQVFLNLVGNAIKFTDRGEVVVRVGVEAGGGPAPEGEVGLRVAVTDTGIGIPADKQEKIFRAFEQEDTSTTRKYGGTGLGLTIAARLAALMGGTITVDSRPGRGSTFAFTARLTRRPQTAAEPPALLPNLPVLVVDDNATNRHILEEWLRGWRMEPAAVADAAAAMDALWHGLALHRPYPLVLLDAMMPGTDGLALAAMIRERAGLAATRIILLTSGDRPGDRARARELNIDAHLLKPVPQDELRETIYRVMSRTAGDTPPAPRPAAAPVPVVTTLRILVAEDNEFNTRHLERLLGRRGHVVQLAGNGREVLALLGVAPGEDPPPAACAAAFDVLLLDLHMPELDGFEVIHAIRERERAVGGHLPVVALTARSRKEDRDQCLAAGMDDYLAKPVRATELLATIQRVVSASGGPGTGS